MIITCPYCDKKFNVDAELIPAERRKLQCGSCDHKWHYKLDNTNLENDDKKNVVKILSFLIYLYFENNIMYCISIPFGA